MTKTVFQMFKNSSGEWRSFEAALEFFVKSYEYIDRYDTRENYLPCILDNLKNGNNSIRMKIVDILILLLTKYSDYQSRS